MFIKSLIIAVFLSTPASLTAPSIVQTIQVEVGARSAWKTMLLKTASIASLGLYQAPEIIKQNTPFSIAADHDGIDTDSYTLLQNGVAVRTVAIYTLVNGTVTFDFPLGLPKGSYTFVVVATGPGGGTADSLPLALGVSPGNPTAPKNVRIIRVV